MADVPPAHLRDDDVPNPFRGKSAKRAPEPVAPAPNAQLAKRLAALETQIKAFQRQTEVQLSALLASVQKTLALLDGKDVGSASVIIEPPAPAAAPPVAPLPVAPPAAPPPAPAVAAPAAPVAAAPTRVIRIGGGESSHPPANAVALPHLLAHAAPRQSPAPPPPAAPPAKPTPPVAAPSAKPAPPAKPAAPAVAIEAKPAPPSAAAAPSLDQGSTTIAGMTLRRLGAKPAAAPSSPPAPPPPEPPPPRPADAAPDRPPPPAPPPVSTFDSEATQQIPGEVRREATAAAAEPRSAGLESLAGMEADEIKRLLERKVAQMHEWEQGASPAERMRTRSLTLTAEELNELRRGGARHPQAEPAPPAAPPATAAREGAIAIPYPEEIEAAKRRMFQLKRVIQELTENPVIPGTNELISVDMRDELTWYSRLIIEDFLKMHERHKERALERYQNVSKYTKTLSDPALFWDREAVAEYRAYCTTGYVEKFLDQLEREIQEQQNARYYALLDFLAGLMSLKRIDVEPGVSHYEPKLHQLANQPNRPPQGHEEKLVTSVLLSGYIDTTTNTLVRRSLVNVGRVMLEEEQELAPMPEVATDPDTTNLVRSAPARPAAPRPPPARAAERKKLDDFGFDQVLAEVLPNQAGGAWEPVFHTPEVDLDALDKDDDQFRAEEATAQAGTLSDPTLPREVPVPEEVSRAQSEIFNFKLTVGNVVRDRKLPQSGGALNDELAGLLTEASNQFLRAFLQLHKSSVEQAQLTYEQSCADHPDSPLDPAHYWDAVTVQAYRDFRCKGFIESFLDRIEARIMGRKLRDHAELLDRLAQDMDLSRIAVVPSLSTPFDPERHEVVAANNLPPGADLRTATVLAVVRSGYLDMLTGKVARKAQVTVKLTTLRRAP